MRWWPFISSSSCLCYLHTCDVITHTSDDDGTVCTANKSKLCKAVPEREKKVRMTSCTREGEATVSAYRVALLMCLNLSGPR